MGSLPQDTFQQLVQEFYFAPNVPYRYDFAVMSRHALSRIYERYVSELEHVNTPQMWLIPPLPTETDARSLGRVYTPEFIAKFFARFLKRNLTPSAFKNAKVADMACGSGIFLRTTLESQIADFADGANLDVKKAVSKAVSNVYAVDIDPNACAATVLSLSALHLVATDKFPRNLRVINDEATEHFSKHEELANSFDAFIVNPPFIRTEQQSNETRKTIAEFLSGIAKGHLDAYAPFLRIGLDVLKPGGYSMFVLPQSFLVSESSKGLRRWLHEHAWILSIADLSAGVRWTPLLRQHEG